MIPLLLGMLLLWAYVPEVSNLGPIPLFTVSIILMAVLVVRRYERVFSVPGFALYFFFGGAFILSQFGAVRPDITLNKTLAWGVLMVSVPLSAIWLWPISKYYIYISRVIMALNFFVYWYVLRYGYQLDEGARFGPLFFSLNGTGYLFVINLCFMWPMVGDKRRSMVERLLAVVSIAITFYMLIFYLGSRASFVISLLIPAIWFSYLLLPSGRQGVSRSKYLPSAILSLILFAGVFYMGYTSFTGKTLPARIQRRFDLMLIPERDSSAALRASYAQKSWMMFQDYPLIGGGWDNFIYYQYRQVAPVKDPETGYIIRYVGDDKHYPHAFYLKVLAELGLVGLVTYTVLTAWTLKRLATLLVTRKEFMLEHGGIWLLYLAQQVFGLSHNGVGSILFLIFMMTQALITQDLWEPQLHWRVTARRGFIPPGKIPQPTAKG